jgi:hypothetical protein
MLSLKQIQNLPVQIRMRILWALVIIIGIGLLAAWVYSTTRIVNRNNGQSQQPSGTAVQQSDTQQYIEAERIEHKDGQLMVYFKVSNPTDNILVMPQPESITLKAGDQTLTPTAVINRQNGNFQQKILSHTDAFGTLIFNDTAIQNVRLTFNSLSFETDDNTFFKQDLDLNLEKLDKPF